MSWWGMWRKHYPPKQNYLKYKFFWEKRSATKFCLVAFFLFTKIGAYLYVVIWGSCLGIDNNLPNIRITRTVKPKAMNNETDKLSV